MMHTKKVVYYIFTLIIFQSSSLMSNSGADMAKAALGLAGSGVVRYGAEKLSQNPKVKEFAETTGVEAKDVGNVACMSGGLFSLSLIAGKESADGLRELAIRAPFAAIVAGLVFTKTFNDIAQYVPVIGSCIACENKKCSGICEKCRLSKTCVAIGIYRTADIGLKLAIDWFTNGKSAS